MRKVKQKYFGQSGLCIKAPQPSVKKDGMNPYVVVFSIDVDADTPLNAAKLVFQIMRDPSSFKPLLQTIDEEGNVENIDLQEEL